MVGRQIYLEKEGERGKSNERRSKSVSPTAREGDSRVQIAHRGARNEREVKGERESAMKGERQSGTNVEGRENREADYPCALRPAAVAKPVVLRLHSLFIRRVARARGGPLMKGVY